MANTNNAHARAVPAGETLLAASRQVWLAGLGAAVVTRDWAQQEAGTLFRTLVKEGTAVESRTFRLVGDRLETSISMANDLWRQTRTSVTHTVKQAAETATTLVRDTLPRRLPKVALPAAFRPKATAKTRAAKAVKARAKRTAKGVKRSTKRATKRG
jgi:Poly(hydroxyalcanoate) granule associated protein (phasin)